jgi:hypothetical protein
MTNNKTLSWDQFYREYEALKAKATTINKLYVASKGSNKAYITVVLCVKQAKRPQSGKAK